jgi:hypothetical protein
MVGIFRLLWRFLDTTRIAFVHGNERRPFASDLEGFTKPDSLTLDKLIKPAFMLAFDQ